MLNKSNKNKLLPYDNHIEKALLGAMLLDNSLINKVFSQIDSQDFYVSGHQILAKLIWEYSDKSLSVDPVKVISVLEERKQLNFVGGLDYINSLMDGIPTNINVEEYTEILRDKASLRKVLQSFYKTIDDGNREGFNNAGEIIDSLQETLIRQSDLRQKVGFVSGENLFPETLDYIEKIQKHGDIDGIKSDFIELDDKTSGFHKSDLIVLAARPSMGKTALGLNMALNMALNSKKKIGFFSIEMNKLQIAMRLIAIRAEIDLKVLFSGKPKLKSPERERLNEAINELQNAEIYIDDSPSLSVVEMKTKARRLQQEKGLDIVFIDYLQLLKVGFGNRNVKFDSRANEVAFISSSLKEMAKELNIPVVALAQLNRAPESRGNRRSESPKYQLSDLKESGAIEQDADLIIFIHREEQQNHDTERKGEADLIIAKQRNGPTGRIVLAYLSQYTKFANMARDDAEYLF